MLNLNKIHKPTTVEDALKLLQESGTVPLAGGTQLIADKRRDVRAVVDLRALGLTYIRESNGMIAIGATTTLAELAGSPILRVLAKGVIAQAAHRSAASVLRNQATIAGALISEPDAILAVVLLALDARVTIVGKETRTVGLAEFLAERTQLLQGTLLTEIALPMSNPHASLHTVARTPRDKPIVSVCAAARIETQSIRCAQNDKIARDLRIALGGVAEHAVRAHAAERVLEGQTLNDPLIGNAARAAAQGLSPHGDFRGSKEYRQEMAIVLTQRAIKELTA